MKILHVCETVKGGTATYLNELIPLLQAKLGTVSLTLLLPREQASETPDIDPASLLFFSRPSRVCGVFYLFGAVFMALVRFRPTIVHAHSTFAGVVTRLLGPLFGAKVIYCPHGWAMDREQPALLRQICALVERTLGHLTAHFIAISDHERRRGIETGIPAEKITTVHNGLRAEQPAFVPAEWTDERLKVLFVGRLDRDKGVDVLLRASQGLDACLSVRIIGSAVIEKVSFVPQDFPHVQFIDWMEMTSVSAQIAACDVVVVPSRWEGFGYVAAEAMRLSKPVMAASVGGLLELVEDGKTGSFFPSEDSAALAALLTHVDRQKLLEMGRAGRARFLEKFTSQRMADAIVDVYQRVAG